MKEKLFKFFDSLFVNITRMNPGIIYDYVVYFNDLSWVYNQIDKTTFYILMGDETISYIQKYFPIDRLEMQEYFSMWTRRNDTKIVTMFSDYKKNG